MLSTRMPNDKPRALIVIEENIPLELREKPQWVLWRYIWVAEREKWTKVPYQPNKRKASTTNSATWYTYDTIIHAYHNSNNFFDGIGFVFNADYTGIDHDHSTDVQQLINDINSYAEYSPSGNGVHIITRDPVSTVGTGKRDDKRGIEMYYKGRYFTVTGNKLPNAPQMIAVTNGAVAALYNTLNKAPEKPTDEREPQTPHIDTPITEKPAQRFVIDTFNIETLLAKNNGFAKLWRGNWQGSYTSASEGVHGLLTDLLKLTRTDQDDAIYWFRQSPFYKSNPTKYDRTVQEYDIKGAFNNLLTKLNIPIQTNNPLTVLTEEQANNLQAPTWVLDGIIVKGEISIISGKKGSFKTFEAIHQTLKVAQQMNTLYIAAEDPIGVSIRRQAWRKHYNCTTGVMLTIPQAVKFHDPQDCANLLDLITLYSIGHVTIDTIAACTRGLNENDAKDMGTVLEGLERIREQSGVNMLVLAHESSKQANGIRGWSGIGDASYVELSAQRQKGSNVVTLKGIRTKMALEQDFTHTLIEVDKTMVVTELLNPTFQYPQYERAILHTKEEEVLTVIRNNGITGITRKALLLQLTDPNPNSVSVMLTKLKKEYKLIQQEKQSAPYTITPRGIAWFSATTDDEDTDD